MNKLKRHCQKIKVLWLTSTPSLFLEHITKEKTISGGWISSLEKYISKHENIQLTIAFHCNSKKLERVDVNNSVYFKIPYKRNQIIKYYKRITHSIENKDDIKFYLKIIDEVKPDVIHIFGTELGYGKIITKVDIPVVIQIQGNITIYKNMWFRCGLTHFDIFKYSNIISLLLGNGIFHTYHKFKKMAKREQHILTNCRYIIGRTDWDKRICSILAPEAKYFYCEEIIRDEFYNLSNIANFNNIPIFSSTMFNNIYKGLETILEASNILKNKLQLKFQWNIYGISENDEIISIFENKFKLKFNESNVYFKGQVCANELANSLSKTHIFIHPSHIENSPNSIAEAMLLGLPIIATYAGGIPSILKDRHEGILVQDGDYIAMSGAIIEILQDNRKAKFYGKNAKNSALRKHNPVSIEHTLINIYNEIIKIESNK